MQSETQIVMDVIIISEYLNSYCRIEHKATAPEIPFKRFRNSASFAAVGKTATIYARNILKLCQRCNNAFVSTDIDQVLGDFETGVNDINDGLLTDACRQNKWKLVTNDGDFIHGGIEVLTVNHKLLAACP